MTKAQTIAYWVTTGILVFCMTGGIFELLSVKMTIEGMMRLGYPAYIIPFLGLGKVLAVVAMGLPIVSALIGIGLSLSAIPIVSAMLVWWRTPTACSPTTNASSSTCTRTGSPCWCRRCYWS